MSTATELIKTGVQASIFLTVLGMGLVTTWSDATQLLRRPGLLARSLLAMFVAMPVICVGAALLFHLPPAVKVALVALAISPVPPFLPKKELMAGGHGAYAISLLSIAAVLSVVYVPLLTSFFGRWFDSPVEVGAGKVAEIVATTILVPLALGMVIRSGMPSVAAKAAKPVGLIATVLLVVCLVPLLIGVWPLVSAFIGDGTVITLAVIALVGTAVGHLLGGPDNWDRTVLGLSTSARHPAVAIAVATSALAPGQHALGGVLLYVLVVTVVTVPYALWSKRHGPPAGVAA